MSDIKEFLRALSPLAWALVAAAVLAIALLTLSYWSGRDRGEATAARAGADAAFSDARAKAGADAVDVVTDNAARSSDIDDRVKGSEDAIRNAPLGQRDAVTVRELCKSPSARRRPECAVQRPGS